eukprot:11721215-Heterocapsa_arctica.AAC.1
MSFRSAPGRVKESTCNATAHAASTSTEVAPGCCKSQRPIIQATSRGAGSRMRPGSKRAQPR